MYFNRKPSFIGTLGISLVIILIIGAGSFFSWHQLIRHTSSLNIVLHLADEQVIGTYFGRSTLKYGTSHLLVRINKNKTAEIVAYGCLSSTNPTSYVGVWRLTNEYLIITPSETNNHFTYAGYFQQSGKTHKLIIAPVSVDGKLIYALTNYFKGSNP